MESIDTPSGLLIGRLAQDESVVSFRGIPYALPPVGSHRWRPPVSYPKWQGERLAREFGPACMQPGPKSSSNTSLYSYRPAEQSSEDCLYVNVWTPVEALNKGKKALLPVMIWVHGGGFKVGSSSMDLYNGSALAKKGVVVVSFNYRLGIFGYFSHPELTAGPEERLSANYGTLDQLEALYWVKKNIAAFGGDPNNITIFGESAGGTSVSHLMATPKAKGLFHRAILQSATLPPAPDLKKSIYGLPSSDSVGVKIQKSLGVKSFIEMKALPAVDILKAAEMIPYLIDPGPIVDGVLFDRQIFEVFAQGRLANVPMLVGLYRG